MYEVTGFTRLQPKTPLFIFLESTLFFDFEHPYEFFLLYQLGVLHVHVSPDMAPFRICLDFLTVNSSLHVNGKRLLDIVGTDTAVCCHTQFSRRSVRIRIRNCCDFSDVGTLQRISDADDLSQNC